MPVLEILGAVASSIAIVEVVGKLGKQAIALKRLCDEIEDIPRTLQDHIDHLNRLVPILDRMEKELVKAPSLLKEGSFAQQSFDYSKGLCSSLEGFASYYFGASEDSVKGWRELARWIFRDAQPSELTLSKSNDPWSPLVLGFISNLKCSGDENHGSVRSHFKLRHWLEDLDIAGVNLIEYGKLESAQLTKTHETPTQTLLDDLCWDSKVCRNFLCCSTREHLPYRLTYGPCPEDWHVLLMSEVFFAHEMEGCLEDFWNLTEPFETSIPGAWVDET